MTENTPRSFDRLDYVYKLMVVVALTIAAIILASDIIIPIAFAGLFSIMVLPIIKKMERRKIPTWLSITIVLLVTIVIFGLFIWLIIGQMVSLVNDLPNLQVKFDAFISNLQTMLLRDFGISGAEQSAMIRDLMKTFSAMAAGILLGTTNAISTLVQIPIYIFLFLIYRHKFRDFFVSLLPGNEDLAWKKDVERVVQGYLSGLFLVTLIIATLNAIGLMIVGIDHAIFFGILSGVLTIIPYVGIIIGALFPIVMALITKDSLWYAIGVVIVFSIVQFLEGNFITPRITGSKVSINALAAIVALVIGGKILGIAGMILAVPAIGLVKILISHSTHLKHFVILLEDSSPKKETVLEESVEEPMQSSSQE
ncbi:AI-2E family transporter [Pseudochryseolinea flava]|uniref:AI-2E family transporter n=1 Tax=Pseudochryseolinea flava TaxID=2059302 RepID=A0A364XWM4_9BACT|nr:AI-2E family transporter [Pseudochryseolinea flava]RAV98612.1 AI-2E family transporter [Pseudochryseolinea flava]